MDGSIDEAPRLPSGSRALCFLIGSHPAVNFIRAARLDDEHSRVF